MDAFSVYHQIMVALSSRDKLAFAGTNPRKYRYKVMPFGPVNAPAILLFLFTTWTELGNPWPSGKASPLTTTLTPALLLTISSVGPPRSTWLSVTSNFSSSHADPKIYHLNSRNFFSFPTVLNSLGRTSAVTVIALHNQKCNS